MHIRIVAIGTRMPDWVTQGTTEYLKRLPREFGLEVIELPLGFRGKNQPLQKAIDSEGQSMLQAVPSGSRIIALDRRGIAWSTEQLADELRQWQLSGENYCLLIGGPDGLADSCLKRADRNWSLSNLTLPHPLVRILLAEQLYRAWTITTGHPYHK